MPGLVLGSADSSTTTMDPEAQAPYAGDKDMVDEYEEAAGGPDGSEQIRGPPDAGGPRLRRHPTAQDWDGPDDPENPHNWGFWSRVYHTALPALTGFLVTLGSSAYTPAVPDVMVAFNVSQTVALLGLSLYVAGLAFGPILAAPMSETLGRRAVYLISYPIAALFTLGVGLSTNFASLAICRFFAGFFGSPTLTIGAGTNADLWPPIDRAVAAAFFVFAPFAGPALGPIIGGFASMRYGWQWTQWPLLFVAIPIVVCSALSRETYKRAILQKRARRLDIPPPPRPDVNALAAIKRLFIMTLARPLHMLFTEPIVAFLSLYVAFNFSVLFGFFDAFPIVFEGVYGMNRGLAGLPWLAVLVGCILAVVTIIVADKTFYSKQFRMSHSKGRGGAVAPEHRLYTAMIGSLGLPIGLFWFGWTSRADIHWISPTLAAIPFGWGNLCVFSSSVLYVVDTYGPIYGASAVAGNSLLRYIMGAAFPLFTVQMYDRLSIPWATSLFGFISLLLLPIPWILFRFGPRIRSLSKYETIRA